MTRQSSTASRRTPVATPAGSQGRPLHVLIVDRDESLRPTLETCPSVRGQHLHFASTLAQARVFLTSQPINIMLVEPQTVDGAAMKLAREVLAHRSGAQVILLVQDATSPVVVEAMRAGITDLLTKPLDPRDTEERLHLAMERARAHRRVHNRVRNLRKLCRSLDQARQEIAQQVDTLCNDLVNAYQELAQQMQQAIQSSEFNAAVRSELDLEQFVRKLLEYVLDKAGPTNAAVFLPSGGDEYALGGYINYDCSQDSPDFLLQHLGDVLAPQLAEREGVVHLTDNQALVDLVGEGWHALEDCHLAAITCRHEQEALAVIVLFRNHAQAFDEEVLETLSAIADTVGTSLARIIRVHHRHLPEKSDESDTPGLEAA